MPLLGAVLAITLSLREYPANVHSDGEISVTAGLECSKCSDSYLRAVFFPEGSRYFGYTQNNAGEWISTVSDKTRYFLITAAEIESGSWSGQLRAKPDAQSSCYTGPGAYSFKLIRYTPSGSKSAESEVVTINISGPTPTPVPASNTPSPVPPSPSRIPSSTRKPSPAVTAMPVQEILGTTSYPTQVRDTPEAVSPSPMPIQPANSSFLPWTVIAISAGGLLVSVFIYFLPKDILRRQ